MTAIPTSGRLKLRVAAMTHHVCEPYLLTPGPLTTSLTVKQAMLRDWGSRDRDFMALNARVRQRLA